MRRLAALCVASGLAAGLLVGCSSDDFDLDDSRSNTDGSITIDGNVIGDEIADCSDLTEGTTPDCTGLR